MLKILDSIVESYQEHNSWNKIYFIIRVITFTANNISNYIEHVTKKP